MKLLANILFIFILLFTNIYAQVFVATDGNDSNPGTIEQPLATMQRAQELVDPGDTVYIRGGTYLITEDQISEVVQDLFACITYLDKSGTEGNTIKYWAYPGETPQFDYTNVKPAGNRVVGIYVIGDYIHIKGLEMTGIQVTITEHTESYCIYSRGNNNIYENLSMHDNIGTGLRHYRGGGNLFLNCDAYRNWDNVSENGLGSNTDGFGCHPNPGSTGNVFRGCRAWFNSDDGFDIIRADESVVFDSCWAFYNGFSKDFKSLGDGNGFKAGGYAHDTADKIPDPIPRNTIRFCIAARNKANGFYANHHLGGNDWFNNSAYLNNTNFNMLNRPSVEDSENIDGVGYDHVLKNNLNYRKYGLGSGISNLNETQNTQENNSWILDLSLADSDFVSLDIDLLTAPRKDDGSLPDVDFMKPVSNSSIIDAGIDIGFDYLGNAPELGAIEIDTPVDVEEAALNKPSKFNLFQNYPNPFNPYTNIRFQLSENSHVRLYMFNSLGEKISTLIDEEKSVGEYEVQIDGSNLSSGVYFYELNSGKNSIIKQMILLK